MHQVGERIREIRRLLGSAVKPLPYSDFAALIRAKTGADVSAKSLARYEQGDRAPGLDEITAIATVDPMQRGPAYLAFGDTIVAPPPQPKLPLPYDEGIEPPALSLLRDRRRVANGGASGHTPPAPRPKRRKGKPGR